MSISLINRASRKRLPNPPAGWFDLGFRLTQDGGIGLLRCTDDRFLKTARGLEPGPARSELPRPGTRGRLSRFDGEIESDVVELDLTFPFPDFDRLPNGDWVIANSRCRPGENNAAIIAPSGSVRHEFCLGDGIQHLQCDEHGTIWVGYFDEGVYGNLGWGVSDGPAPIGGHGLIRFDTGGAPIWAFDSPAVGAPFIDDCYALNVANGETWTCYYSDFPIVRIGTDGSVCAWDNSIKGAAAIAAEDGQVMLAGGYGDDWDRIVLLGLSAHRASLLASCRLGLDRSGGAFDLLVARGSRLHLVRDSIWYRLSLSDLRRAVAAQP